MKKSNRVIIGIVAFLIFIIAILGSVSTSVFELNFYNKAQAKYDVAKSMNLDDEDVTNATIVALLYTKGLSNDLTYMINENNQEVDLYSSQDKEHMIDVQNLYGAMYKTLVFSGISLFIAIIILLIRRKQINTFTLTLILNKVSIYTLLFTAIIALFAFVNFEQFWVFFHKVFFRNDLWLMNPYQDALVNLFPEGLFMDLVYRIIAKFVLIFSSVNIIAYLYRFFSLKGVKND